jgi:hypothetical protein
LPRIVFVEGLDFLVPNASDIECVPSFLKYLARIADWYNLALIGSVGSPKRKAGEGYVAKRDSLFGSMAWGRLSTTIVMIDFPDGDDMSDKRVLSVLPRNAKAEKFSLTFDHRGTLQEVHEEKKRPVPTALDWLAKQKDWFTETKFEMEMGWKEKKARHQLAYWEEEKRVEV